jgi:hypothetical protein
MITPLEIAEAGLRHVESYLVSTGYHCSHNKSHNGATDIEARGEEESLFVHVMCALAPGPVPELTTADNARVLSRAMTVGYDAWLATVLINTDSEPMGDIQWRQLNH